MFSIQDGKSLTFYLPQNENKTSLPFMIEMLEDELIMYVNSKNTGRILEKHIAYADAITLHIALCKIGIGPHKSKTIAKPKQNPVVVKPKLSRSDKVKRCRVDAD